MVVGFLEVVVFGFVFAVVGDVDGLVQVAGIEVLVLGHPGLLGLVEVAVRSVFSFGTADFLALTKLTFVSSFFTFSSLAYRAFFLLSSCVVKSQSISSRSLSILTWCRVRYSFLVLFTRMFLRRAFSYFSVKTFVLSSFALFNFSVKVVGDVSVQVLSVVGLLGLFVVGGFFDVMVPPVSLFSSLSLTQGAVLVQPFFMVVVGLGQMSISKARE